MSVLPSYTLHVPQTPPPPAYCPLPSTSIRTSISTAAPFDQWCDAPPSYHSRKLSWVSYGPEEDKPDTLAKYYFKFGFVLPVLWIAGACIIWSSLKIDSRLPFRPELTEAEKAVVLHRMRVEELQWAWRCLWACVILLSFLAATLLVALGLLIYAPI